MGGAEKSWVERRVGLKEDWVERGLGRKGGLGMAGQGVEDKGLAREKGWRGGEKIRMRAGNKSNEDGDGKDGRKEELSRGEKNGRPASGRVGRAVTSKRSGRLLVRLLGRFWRMAGGPRGPAPTPLPGLPSRASPSDAWSGVGVDGPRAGKNARLELIGAPPPVDRPRAHRRVGELSRRARIVAGGRQFRAPRIAFCHCFD